MKKAKNNSAEIRPEYQREDFGSMERGKYAKKIRENSNVVVLDPDVAEAFPNSQVVNDTLRRLIELAKANVRIASQE